MKYFGRLFGRAPTALVDVSPSNNSSPYTASLPGSKMMSQGEGSSAAAHNRALGALQENIEYITDILDSPALAESRIVANTSAAFGSSALHNTSLAATTLDLCASEPAPIHWVYVGFHKSELGKFIRAYRYDLIGDVTTAVVKQRGLDVYDQLNPTDALHMNSAAPTDVWEEGVTVLPSTTYLTAQDVVSPHALKKRVRGIVPCAPNLAPYNGVAVTKNVATWHSDGCCLELGKTWQDLYMQAGCYVHIQGASPNRGLYRIAHVTVSDTTALSKVVLTRGGLCRVTVLDGTKYVLGTLVSWQNRPNGDTTSGASARENYAYVMFIDGNTLYLSSIQSEIDTPQSVGAFGMKVDNAGTYGSVRGISAYGLLDQESGTRDNWSITTATVLYSVFDSTQYSTVTAALPPGYPVLFDTTLTNTATPCSPPGFVLNPVLKFTAGDITGGQYTVQCKTLSTVREQLKAQGAGANKLIQNAASRLGYNEFEAGMVRAFARYVKTGDEDFGIRSGGASNPVEYPAGPFTGTNTLLGENLWKITFTGATTLAASLALENGGVYIGQPCSFVSATASVGGGFAVTTAKWVAVTGQVAIVSDVATSSWTPRDIATNAVPVGYSPLPITTNATVTTNDGAVHTVSVINYAPVIQQSDNVSPLYPSQGLEAAYNNHYAAAKTARGNGLGNQILMQNSRPITAVLINGYNATTGAFRVSTISTAAAYTLIDCVARDTDTSVANVAVQAGGVLSFGDVNKSVVPLTTAVTGVEFPTNFTNGSAPTLHTSILTSLSRLNNEQAVKFPVRVATLAASLGAAATYTQATKRMRMDAVGVVAIDGVTPINLYDRILLKDAANGVTTAQLGIYICTTAGTGGVRGEFTRAGDADTELKLIPGMQVEVLSGTQANTVWSVTNTTPINANMNTTVVTFAQTGGKPSDSAATYTNGAYASGSSGTSQLWSRSDHTHGGKRGVRLVTAVDSVTTADDVVLFTCAGANYGVTLPTGNDGMRVLLRKKDFDTDAKIITVSCNVADTINLADGIGYPSIDIRDATPVAELVYYQNVWYALSYTLV